MTYKSNILENRRKAKNIVRILGFAPSVTTLMEMMGKYYNTTISRGTAHQLILDLVDEGVLYDTGLQPIYALDVAWYVADEIDVVDTDIGRVSTK